MVSEKSSWNKDCKDKSTEDVIKRDTIMSKIEQKEYSFHKLLTEVDEMPYE